MRKPYFCIPFLVPLLLLFGCGGYALPNREKVAGKIVNTFIKKMEPKGLQAIGVGGAERDGKNTEIAVTFNSDQIFDIEIARKIVVEAAECLLQIISEQKEEDQVYFDPFPPSVDIARFIISSKEPEDPDTRYISTVFLSDGKVRYCEEHPDPDDWSLVAVKKESYEEARKIVFESQ